MKILVADDEEKARQRVIRILKEELPDADILTAENGKKALEILDENEFDIAFLDLEMPYISGLDVAFTTKNPCKIVFVTAFDNQAVNAFEAEAVDFVLKPFSEERLIKALNRAQKLNKNSKIVKKLRGKFSFKIDGNFKFVELNKISAFIAKGDYIEIYEEDNSYLAEYGLQATLERLPTNFIRIHRSTVINIDFIEEIKKSSGKLSVILNDNWNHCFSVSNTYREKILALIK